MNTTQTERTSVYERITQQIIHAIESGTAQYRMPWHSRGADSALPVNAVTRKPYRGVNILCLSAQAAERTYPSHLWATFNQWKELGANVRKSEKATLIVFWKFWRDEEEAEGEDRKGNQRCMARAYFVFNAAQVDGYALPEIPTIPEATRIASAETFFAATGATIKEQGNRAFYRPATDEIVMPPFTHFKKAEYFYSTLAHEVTHFTARPERCNRTEALAVRFGSEAYAMEELIAELGSAFLSADLGLALEPRTDHAGYIENWLGVLKKDNRAIFAAAAKAQAAIDWLHAQQQAKEASMGPVEGMVAEEVQPFAS